LPVADAAAVSENDVTITILIGHSTSRGGQRIVLGTNTENQRNEKTKIN